MVGLDALRRVRDAIDASVSLVAIGGITGETARSALEAGADSVAVVSALVGEPELIAERTKAFRKSLP